MFIYALGHSTDTNSTIQTITPSGWLNIFISACFLVTAFAPAQAMADEDKLTLASSNINNINYQVTQTSSTLSSRINDILYKDLDLEKQLISFLKNYPDGEDIQTPMLQYRVGLLFKNGRGMEKNITKAIHWLQKSADKNYAAAQFELGLLHKNGNGVNKDLVKAREWFNKARSNGYAVSADILENTTGEKL